MKTTIDIPEKMLAEVIKRSGSKTKREAILAAVDEFNKRRRLEELAERLQGSCPNFMTQADLRKMREDRKWEAGK